MISKCQNIVINRTKFSEFLPYDVASEGSGGLKLVGYIEMYDPCKEEVIKKNVAIDYPSTPTVQMPPNCTITDIMEGSPDTAKLQPLPVGDINVYTVKSAFEGETITINFKQYTPELLKGILFPVSFKGKDYNCFNLSFSRDIPTGREIKVIFNNFPVHYENVGIALLDFAYGTTTAGSINGKELLIEGDTTLQTAKTFVVTFVQTLNPAASVDSASTRMMVATRIELID